MRNDTAEFGLQPQNTNTENGHSKVNATKFLFYAACIIIIIFFWGGAVVMRKLSQKKTNILVSGVFFLLQMILTKTSVK